MTTAPGSGEDGFTLIELVITIAIIGIAFVGMLGALQVGIVASMHQRQLATAEGDLRSLAENVRAAAYVGCAGTAAYGSGFVASDGVAAEVAQVEHWDGSWDPAAPPSFVTACAGDNGLQRVTLRVTSSEIELSTVLLKRARP